MDTGTHTARIQIILQVYTGGKIFFFSFFFLFHAAELSKNSSAVSVLIGEPLEHLAINCLNAAYTFLSFVLVNETLDLITV